jgi:hypothetical protein
MLHVQYILYILTGGNWTLLPVVHSRCMRAVERVHVPNLDYFLLERVFTAICRGKYGTY